MAELEGRVALVTGGGRGLGAAVALALAEAGADVALLGRDAATLDAVGQAIGERGRRSVTVVADVASWDETRAAVEAVEQALGPVAILVNNAGIVSATGNVAGLDPAAWARDLAVDLNGPFYCARAVLPGMTRLGWGHILNITSGAGTQPIAGAAAYSVAKADLNFLTRILALELAGSGGVAIAVNPGMLDTDMQTGLRANPAAEFDFFRGAQARGWLRPAEEPAALVRWLCGPAGEEFAGQVVSVGAPEIRARVGLPALPGR
ncbi:MAG TPA: SDR family NAD(P)-dependent oxidoreductase [Ktedonobacterales bacterium]